MFIWLFKLYLGIVGDLKGGWEYASSKRGFGSKGSILWRRCLDRLGVGDEFDRFICEGGGCGGLGCGDGVDIYRCGLWVQVVDR